MFSTVEVDGEVQTVLNTATPPVSTMTNEALDREIGDQLQVGRSKSYRFSGLNISSSFRTLVDGRSRLPCSHVAIGCPSLVSVIHMFVSGVHLQHSVTAPSFARHIGYQASTRYGTMTVIIVSH